MIEASDFFKAIDGLNTGDRALLRRASGMTIDKVGAKARRPFYRCGGGKIPGYLEEHWFACACLHCIAGPSAERRPLPEIIGQMRQLEQLSESQIDRVLGMLDTAWRSDGYLLARIARLVRMLHQREHAVDCESLLADLVNWNRSDQRVQRRWGKIIFAPRAATAEETDEADEAKEEPDC